MPWCSFYDLRVEADHHPRDDNFCRAPDSLLKDVITCEDCGCYHEIKPEKSR